jgi:membrane associated rhomboid family serine protease
VQLLVYSRLPEFSSLFYLVKSNLLGFRETVFVGFEERYVYSSDGITKFYGATGPDDFQPIQLALYFFSHSNFLESGGTLFHILFNMFALVNIGPAIENVIGAKRFIIYYLFTGFVGGLIITFLDPSNTPVVGSSVALSGLLLKFAFLYPDAELFIFPIPFPIKAMKLLYGVIAISVLLLFISSNAGGISHFGHLSGFFAGYIFTVLEKKTNIFN